MSENSISFIAAGVELQANEQDNLAAPSWLTEALLVGQYWQSSGLLSDLVTQVQVSRGRMGQYEVCDFVLLMLAYAVSGLPSLAEFYRALIPVKSLLMAVWGRQRCPVASTLSRFLADIDAGAVALLRTLFETDLHRPVSPLLQQLGLRDRTGARWMVFDVDGTVKSVRHRVLQSQSTHPVLKRRSRRACAPGYRGRKRGQAVRTRTTIAQAHTREWLGNFAVAGNGDAKGELNRACGVIERYCAGIELPLQQAILRLDGFYGRAHYLRILQQKQIPYITRCCDYQLLKDPGVKAQLAKAPQQKYEHPDSPEVSRELFDIPYVDATARGYLAPLRLIVLRLVRFPKAKPSVGKCEGKYVYEVFQTSLPADGFSAADVLSLYNGRGGFEQTLSEEDTEQDCDRWCSWHPQGQTFWQILSQWVWNWRLRAGWQSQSPLDVRRTLWSPAVETSVAQPAEEIALSPNERQTLKTSIEAPQVSVDESASPLSALAPSPQYGPITLPPVNRRHQLTGKAFKIIDECSIECPAGHRMEPQESGHDEWGNLQILFGVKATTCRDCSLMSQCHAKHSKNTRGRRLTVTRARLPSPPQRPDQTDIVVQAKARPSPSLGTKPLLWIDLPATALRRQFKGNLERQQLDIQSMATPAASAQTLFTRHQRAHRRLSWKQRLNRNRLQGKQTIGWKVQLFGISPTLAQFLKCTNSNASEPL